MNEQSGWDQGSVSTITSLPGFQHAFGISSATNPKQVSDFISLVYVGASVGAASTYFVNDVWGRLWAFRFYGLIWIIGQLMAVASSGNIGAMYAARIIAGLGIGPMTVIGPVALSEVAPAEIRGLITSWFSVIMLLTLTTAAFTVFGVLPHGRQFLTVAHSVLRAYHRYGACHRRQFFYSRKPSLAFPCGSK